MRVIGGCAGGLRLQAPRGEGTRPVTDRVKETLFAILGERVREARVLDLYAGSGALGIEALSRGAIEAVFVERDRAAAAVIGANLAHTRLADGGRVVIADVERFLASAPDGAYDLALLDPPYTLRAILPPLEALLPWLAADATVVIKHFWRTAVPEPAGLAIVRGRRFGETALTFLAPEAHDR
jgi:16S rRNA (guanine966-N2)-methyltransferase